MLAAEVDGSDHTPILLSFTPAFGWFGISLDSLIFGNVRETFRYSFEWMTAIVFRVITVKLSFGILESEDQLVKNQ